LHSSPRGIPSAFSADITVTPPRRRFTSYHEVLAPHISFSALAIAGYSHSSPRCPPLSRRNFIFISATVFFRKYRCRFQLKDTLPPISKKPRHAEGQAEVSCHDFRQLLSTEQVAEACFSRRLRAAADACFASSEPRFRRAFATPSFALSPALFFRSDYAAAAGFLRLSSQQPQAILPTAKRRHSQPPPDIRRLRITLPPHYQIFAEALVVISRVSVTPP